MPTYLQTRLTGLLIVGCFALAVFACSKPGPTTTEQVAPTAEGVDRSIQFEDVTAASGINFTYRNGEEAGHLTLLESLGGGVALFDYDRDGLLDIFVTGGGYFDGKTIRGYPGRLYRNLGNFKFEDVTERAGLNAAPFYGHGVAVADYDNDGWPDLLVTGYGGVRLYHNERGKFVDVTDKAGLRPAKPPVVDWCTSAAWGDLNSDGFPDLYITRYVDWSFENHPKCPGYLPDKPVGICSPRNFKGLPDSLFLNNGDGTFRDASSEWGLRPDGKGLGVLIADLDGDGKPDVYVANDTTENFLYLNKGGKFEEAGFARGVAYDGGGTAQGSMGVDAADYDGTGRFSLFVTNYQNEPHALYRNLGAGRFHFASQAAGITAIGFAFVGFGTAFADFDRDGAEDLIIANGHISHDPAPPSEYKQRPVVFRNLARAEPGTITRFRDVSAHAGPYFQTKRVGRGVAVGDLNTSGRLDIVISHTNEPVAILRNTSPDNHHWLGVALVGKPGRDATGAVLTLEAGGRKLVRQVKGGGSYLSSSDRRILFGIDTATDVGTLTVRWPSGKVQTWDKLAVDHYWVLTEGEAAPAAWPARP